MSRAARKAARPVLRGRRRGNAPPLPDEPEFAALRHFALGGTDHHTHAWQGEMIDRYMRWCNARAQPKTSFAPNSIIRTWTGYPGFP